jgi:hypothetical protein
MIKPRSSEVPGHDTLFDGMIPKASCLQLSDEMAGNMNL